MKTKKQIEKARDKIRAFMWDLEMPPCTYISEETEIVLKVLDWVLEDKK